MNTPLKLLIQRYLHLIPKESLVLDLGCGEGNDALLLARQGFCVEAVDTATILLENLKKLVEKEHITTLTIHPTDIRTFPFLKTYGTIVCMNVLHFLKKEAITTLIKKMKEVTQPKGIHFISVFTTTGDLHSNTMHFFTSNELKEYYTDWNILYYTEIIKPTRECDSAGNTKHHEVAFLVAQKLM